MKNICRALIWNACFFEMSEDDIIDPDSAVKALEGMASILQAATSQEKKAFKEACIEEAQQLKSSSDPGYAKVIEFIFNLPDSFGI